MSNRAFARAPGLCLSALAAFTWLSSCTRAYTPALAPPVTGVTSATNVAPANVVELATAPDEAVAEGTEGAASAPPQSPSVIAPLPGDPDADQLAEARLVSDSCATNQRAAEAGVRRRIAAMRSAVDEEFREWRSLPLCPWLLPKGADDFGWGHGSLGLSGVGEGGGGYAEGIGLGSVGLAPPRASRASGTNNQVESVDEADFVKNDGRYVYLLTNGALRIVEALRPRLLSVTKLVGEAREMLVEGDRAVVFMADDSHTRMIVIDLADRSKPNVVRRIAVSGSLTTARRIGNVVHAVVADNDTRDPGYETSPQNLPECHENEPVVRARFERLKRDNERLIRASAPHFPTLTDGGVTRQLCEVMSTPLQDGEAFTTVLSFDMTHEAVPVTTATVQSPPGTVFASERSLYLAVNHSRASASARWYRSFSRLDEVTDVHAFRIGPSPAATRFVGSGVVPGRVLNQFAMDEWSGHLRVATTVGSLPDPKAENIVSILAPTPSGNLVRVGAIEHVAPGEDIRAVRFDGDRGYVVTFKKTDPLFVLDLKRADRPAVLGELKIPGFSTYLHRIDPNHLLSIGFDAQDHGDFAYFDSVILQLFDVTNPTEPRLLHKETIGTRGTSSEAASNHLAFNYFDDLKLLAIPMTICEGGGDGKFGDKLTFSGLLVYDTTVDRGFRRLGGVDRGTSGARCDAWWSHGRSVVKRSIFMDDLVFSIAGDRMKVQRLGRLGEDVADIALGP